MARLAEQRLLQIGIPSFTRCLRGGPGLWGSAYNLPHDLFVYESDEAMAREQLELDSIELVDGQERIISQATPPNLWLVVVGVILGGLFLLVMVSLFSRPLG